MRSFTEKMRALGYPKLISMDSFRTPNFDLVADSLHWLVKKYDPSIDISDDVSSEQDRIIFIKSIATFMAPKAHIKLNTRKLYMADGYAVKELLKLATLLYDASMSKLGADDDVISLPPLDISGKLAQLKACRALASEITEQGSKLHDSLGKELAIRDLRHAVISRPLELKAIETSVKDAIHNLSDMILGMKTGLENLAADETNLMAKIEKKRQEYERAEKRLKSLQGVRPAYMDEYEKIEVELVKFYEVYMEKFRNLSYLEQQLDEHNRLEQDKFEETEVLLKRMQTRLREEEMRLLRGDKEIQGTVRNNNGGAYGSGASSRPKRPHAAGRRQNLGNGPDETETDTGDSENEDVSIGSELSDGDEGVGEDDDEEPLDVGRVGGASRLSGKLNQPKPGARPLDAETSSDDDLEIGEDEENPDEDGMGGDDDDPITGSENDNDF
ncbi:Clusterin-associated protein 1 [Irineochytrium annulatum]|nr:Clusterin-associated protein 1 [Irineochytrium annulatum]